MSEKKLQAKCWQWLWNEFPETRYCCFHVPNGGSRNKIEAMQLKASGVVAGIPDIILVWRGRFYAFEFKNEKGGVVSSSQKIVHEAWRCQGVEVVIITDFGQWVEVLTPLVKRVFEKGIDPTSEKSF